MRPGTEDPIKFGKWIAAERCKRIVRDRPLSGPALSRMVNAYIKMKRLPVKGIKQQEISRLENAYASATPPKRWQPWWDILHEFMADGALDEMVEASNITLDERDSAVILKFRRAKGEETPVRSPDGKLVGRVVWD